MEEEEEEEEEDGGGGGGEGGGGWRKVSKERKKNLFARFRCSKSNFMRRQRKITFEGFFKRFENLCARQKVAEVFAICFD